MQISKKRFAAVAILPIAALLLSGCGTQTATKTDTTPAKTQNAPQQPAAIDSAQLAAPQASPEQVKAQLAPLPADNKQAIDTQLSSIDKDIKAVDSVNASTDLSNANLGL